MPTWNETRVRVDGFSNSSATLRPRSGSRAVAAGALQLEPRARAGRPSSARVSSVPVMKWRGALTEGF